MSLLIRYFRNISVIFVAFVMISFLCIQIPIIKSHFVQHVLTHFATPHGVSVTVNGVHGILPFQMNIKSIHINDSSGELAAAQELAIDLEVSALLRGKIYIKNLTLNRFEWLRKTTQTHLSFEGSKQLPTIIANIVPIALNQTILKRVDINLIKMPTTHLSFHFQKDNLESLIELKSINEKNDVIQNKTTPDTAPLVHGVFRLAPKDKGATASIRFNDNKGILSGYPLSADGDFYIKQWDTFLPEGNVTININGETTKVTAQTVQQNTQIKLKNGVNHYAFDFNTKQLLENHTSPIQNTEIKNDHHHIRGNGDITFNEDMITAHYTQSIDDTLKITGTSIWNFSDRTVQITGKGNWNTTAFEFDGSLINIGANIRLKHVCAAVDNHTIVLSSDDGLSLDSQNNAFALKIDEHTFTGKTNFNKDNLFMHLQPTWKWAQNTILTVQINTDGARIDGAMDLDCKHLTNDLVQGIGHAIFTFDQTLTGTLSWTLPKAMIGTIEVSKTTANVHFNKGNGVFDITLGDQEEQHSPSGSVKGSISLEKQRLDLNFFQIRHQQQFIRLESPVVIPFDIKKVPGFSITVGEKGIIQCDEKRQHIIFENVPLIAARLLSPSFDVDGLLNGKVEFISLFDRYKGHIVLTQLIPYLSDPLNTNDLFKNFSLTFQFEAREKQILIDMHTNRNQLQIFKAKGAVSLDAETFMQNTIDANIVGEIDISLVSSLLDTSDRLNGMLNMNLTIKGTLADIILSGKIDARDGLYDSAEHGTHISNINGTLKASGKKLIIEKLKGSDIRGNKLMSKDNRVGVLDITGDFEFANFALPIFNLNLKLTDLIVVHRDDMTIRATGDIKINGPGLQSKITGTVNLSPALIMLEEFTNDDILHIKIPEFEKQKADKKKNKTPVFPIELVLNVDKNFYIRDLDLGLISQWSGNITVKDDLSDPYLEGKLTVTKGKFSFFGKQLKIKDATIWYDTEEKNKPNIMLTGTRDVEDVKINISVSGRAPFVKFSFTSDPALPEDEVLSRLLFGKELSKISTGQSIQLASIASSLDTKNKFNFLENLRNSFGFDTFELKENPLKASTSDSGQTASQALSVGKEFENARISIDQSIGSTGSKATVSTALTKNVYLDLELGEKTAGSGAGLSWNFRY